MSKKPFIISILLLLSSVAAADNSLLSGMSISVTNCRAHYHTTKNLIARNAPATEVFAQLKLCSSECSTLNSVALRGGDFTEAPTFCKQQMAALDKNSDGIMDVGAVVAATEPVDPESCDDFAKLVTAKKLPNDKESLDRCTDICSAIAADSKTPVAAREGYTVTALACVAQGKALGIAPSSVAVARLDTNRDGLFDANQEPVIPGDQEPVLGADEVPKYDDGAKDDQIADTENPPAADDDTTGGDDTTTASTNDDYNRQSMLQGLSMPVQGGGQIDLSGYQPINFATGPSPDNYRFRSAAGDVTAASSGAMAPGGALSGTPRLPRSNNRLDKAAYAGNVGPGKALPKPEISPGGGGAGSPPGGGLPPGSGQISAAKARPGGGSRPSALANQLSKFSNNSYHPAGGSPVPVGRSSAAIRPKVLATAKPPKKKDESQAALIRMFGSVPGSQGSGYAQQANFSPGRQCLDTVFCNMENFFNAVDRYPNSEINWSNR